MEDLRSYNHTQPVAGLNSRKQRILENRFENQSTCKNENKSKLYNGEAAGIKYQNGKSGSGYGLRSDQMQDVLRYYTPTSMNE